MTFSTNRSASPLAIVSLICFTIFVSVVAYAVIMPKVTFHEAEKARVQAAEDAQRAIDEVEARRILRESQLTLERLEELQDNL